MNYKSEICEVMHQDAVADFKAGVISEERMREYDKMCLVQEPEASYTVKKSTETEYGVMANLIQ
jgi:DNA-binding transcriptional regulator YiaG